ncbi:MAG: aminotransferase class V-fold PLP-dependent enzyme [Sulfobacillus thermosulfidooxidans]|uniref:aminotransferase class V-fold PLP-dependent enzyme n=1 Tax=Sulfobacillus TaxID=28033 RepID=UPI000CD00B75|nr:aminotransferase class V-fold PLP-dependent enzyme [Sulfobacillus sp. hq2]POB10359.1 cysteine desulfurase [Sulfobacillus sp. hq2]PSR35668.1 MAG: aminotransferase class V-fold PLP-dependent enzyme [Sulfobacillus thermosulfidooxidans]
MFGEDLRLLIPAALRQTYLNTGTLGPTPTPASAAACAAEMEWEEMGPGHVPYYLSARDKARQFALRIEQTMPKGTVSLVHNNTEAIARVLWGLHWSAGDEIITTDHEHPAMIFALSSLIRQFGVKVKVLRVDSSVSLADQLEQRLSPRTKLLAVSHVSYLTGWQLPVESLARVMRQKPDARVLVDGAQALGNIAVDPLRTGADYYVFCGHKWMMAPVGWAGLWVRHTRLQELVTCWPPDGDYDPHVLEREELWPVDHVTGQGLEYGSRDWLRVVGWSVTWDYFEEEGFAAHAIYQSGLALEAAREVALIPECEVVPCPRPEYRPTALMTIRSKRYGAGLAEKLWQRGIVVKPVNAYQGVRVSFALFNTSQDVHALMEGLRTIDA